MKTISISFATIFTCIILSSSSSCTGYSPDVEGSRQTDYTTYPESDNPCDKGFTIKFNDDIETWVEEYVNDHSNRQTEIKMYQQITTGDLYYDFMLDGIYTWDGSYTCNGEKALDVDVHDNTFIDMGTVYDNE